MLETNDNLYSIQFVSNVTGINPHTIRAWEKRYGATSPVRDKNGRRLYSDGEIQRLDLLNKLVSIGNSISDIANLDREQLSSVLERYDSDHLNKEKSKISSNKDFNWQSHLQNIIAGARLNKPELVFNELEVCNEMMDGKDLIRRILLPLMQEVFQLSGSDLYEAKVFDPLCLVIKSFVYKNISLNRKSKGGRKVLVTSLDGELNELASLLTAFFFNLNGDRVEFIGNGQPEEKIIELSRIYNSDIIFVAAGYAPEQVISKETKVRTITKLNEEASNSEIFVGSFFNESEYRGLDIEYINNFDLLFSILENT